MESNYIAYHFTVEPKEQGIEILIAELGEKAFESFIETEKGCQHLYRKLYGQLIF